MTQSAWTGGSASAVNEFHCGEPSRGGIAVQAEGQVAPIARRRHVDEVSEPAVTGPSRTGPNRAPAARMARSRAAWSTSAETADSTTAGRCPHGPSEIARRRAMPANADASGWGSGAEVEVELLDPRHPARRQEQLDAHTSVFAAHPPGEVERGQAGRRLVRVGLQPAVNGPQALDFGSAPLRRLVEVDVHGEGVGGDRVVPVVEERLHDGPRADRGRRRRDPSWRGDGRTRLQERAHQLAAQERGGRVAVVAKDHDSQPRGRLPAHVRPESRVPARVATIRPARRSSMTSRP